MLPVPGARASARLWRRLAQRWLERRVPPEPPEITLHRRRLFILPTRTGYTFALTLAVLLLGSLNYGTSLGFAVTFLLAGAGTLGMLQTYRNLAGVTLTFWPGPAVFAGDVAAVGAQIQAGERSRWALSLTGGERRRDGLAAVPGDPATARVELAAERRGRLRPPRLAVTTIWPLALFRVWSWVWPAIDVTVFPRPVDHGRQIPVGTGTGDRGRPRAVGDEDFAGLRPYHPGDPPRRIDWKTLARTDELHVKNFEAEPPGEIWLDWASLHPLAAEARYEQLCYWTLALRDTGHPFGLELPDARLGPARGRDHAQRCLEALALSQPAPA